MNRRKVLPFISLSKIVFKQLFSSAMDNLIKEDIFFFRHY